MIKESCMWCRFLICKYDNLKLEYKELKILIKYVVKKEIR